MGYQKNNVLEIAYKWITEKSRPVVKTPILTASPFLLKNFRIFPNLFIDENGKLTTIKSQHLKNNEKFQQFNDDNLSSERITLSLPLSLFQSAFDKHHEYSLNDMQIMKII